MVRVLSLAIGLVLLVSVSIPRSGAEPAKPEALPDIRIGLPEALFKDVNKNLVQIVAQPFNDIIQKTVSMNGKLEIFKDYRTIAQHLKEGKLDIAVFHGFEFAWIEKSDPNLVPLAITLPNCGKVQACLVVNVETEAKSPKDLKGACVAIPKGSKAHCQMFLDQIHEAMPKDCKDCCAPLKSNYKKTPEEVLSDVASGQCESALVDVSSLISYRSEYPGLGSCLKVMEQSELLPSAIVVCRKGSLTNDQVKAVKKALMDCANTAQGKAFLMFWNLKGFGGPSDDYFELLGNCRKTYQEPKVAQK